jgi:hypothetical protein
MARNVEQKSKCMLCRALLGRSGSKIHRSISWQGNYIGRI